MKIACFAYNRSERRFFEKIAPHLDATLDIIYINKKRRINPKAYKALQQSNLHEEINFKTAFWQASKQKKSSKIASFFYKYYAKVMANYLFMKYYTTLSQKPNDGLMLWSGVTFRQSIAKKAALSLGLKTLFIENGLLPNTIVLDTKGVNFTNSLPRESLFYQNYIPPNTPLPLKLIPRQPKKEEKFSKQNTKLPAKYIFIPFQVDYDTQLIVNSPWIKDMRTLFQLFESIQNNIKDQQLHFLFKEHPSSLIDYPDLHKEASKNRHLHIINDHSTQELIEKAQAVVTINSTVGIESLLLGKKVIVLGNAFYSIEGITKTAMDKSGLTTVINNLDHWQPDPILREKFLKYLYFEYLVPGTFDEENVNQYNKINQILKKL